MDLQVFDKYRVAFFLAIFLIMSVLEILIPRRKAEKPKLSRWYSNLMLMFTSSLSVRYVLPFTGVTAAIFAKEQGMGFLNDFAVSPILAILLTIVLFDLVIYWQHRLFHKVPILWKLHKVHHADPDYDVTTGGRFHPIEIVLSMIIKIFMIFALGAPVLGVVIFEILLNGTSMFNHSNIRINSKLDGILRKFLVTPDFHRVHHSHLIDEQFKNYGFNLSIWDNIFRSYKAVPEEGHDKMIIGLDELKEDSKVLSLFGMLLIPFTKDR